MGWNCPGGVRQEGNVLREKIEQKTNNQTTSGQELLSVTKWKLLVSSWKCNSKEILENLGATETRKTVFDKILFLNGPNNIPYDF